MMRVPEPRLSYERGYLQCAELIHVARLCWSMGCSNETLSMLVSKLYSYNEAMSLRLYSLSSYNSFRLERLGKFSGFGEYRVVFATERGFQVEFLASWSYSYMGEYVKRLGGAKIIYYNYSIHYEHAYTAPPWGAVTVYPALSDPMGLADIRRIGGGDWLVGVPSFNYTLTDVYGLEVKVGGS